MNYKLSRELLQALLNYLATQPYSDVFQLINELQRLEKVDETQSKK
ncbi:MAG: hypothetical protein ACMXX9_01440 [Candidatus Woesearchaeota archaeon]